MFAVSKLPCSCFASISLAALLFCAPEVRGDDPPKKPAAENEAEHKPAEVKKEAAHDDNGDKKAGDHKDDAYKGDHGDQYDLGYANAGKSQGDPGELRADLAIYSFIVFVLLMAVVTKFAWRPIMDGLAKRENSIAHMIDEAKANQHKAQESLRQYEAKLAAATEETRQMLAQARQDAESAKEKIIAEAQAAAHRERDKSLAEIRAAKEAALREMAQKSVDSAFALATRIVHKEIRPADHSALIAESLAKFPSQN